ncbi:hypothetical protein M405DRAFT_830777 [Rhizopogon salebrosus TDB-379]|nr:hypothetical protein M405DRAFT_830777 [Rhizopogon salebrosus TDB-379]
MHELWRAIMHYEVLLSAEVELMQSVNDLKARNRIFGELQTVEILDPAEEIYGGILDV